MCSYCCCHSSAAARTRWRSAPAPAITRADAPDPIRAGQRHQGIECAGRESARSTPSPSAGTDCSGSMWSAGARGRGSSRRCPASGRVRAVAGSYPAAVPLSQVRTAGCTSDPVSARLHLQVTGRRCGSGVLVRWSSRWVPRTPGGSREVRCCTWFVMPMPVTSGPGKVQTAYGRCRLLAAKKPMVCLPSSVTIRSAGS
jgi:hypothetical protein